MLQSFFTVNFSLTMQKAPRISAAKKQFDCEAKCTCERTSLPGGLSLLQERMKSGQREQNSFPKWIRGRTKAELIFLRLLMELNRGGFAHLCHFLKVLERSKVCFFCEEFPVTREFCGGLFPKSHILQKQAKFFFKWIHFNHWADLTSFRKTHFQKDLLEFPCTPPGNTETTVQRHQI